jgi:3-hydroxyacyl-CoA dehydrogenase/enoyl-CoA hydratase/3-hydroxybutyryl-CoA epimerase
VEVVRAPSTDDATVATLVEFVRRLGKVPVVVKDSPGFLVNRVLFPYLDEAVRMVIEGYPGAELDAAAVRFGMPVGPLELLDQVGIDIAADVARTFAALARDPGPVPARFAEMVKDGALGKKAGRGFYEYPKGDRGEPTRWALPAQPRVTQLAPDDEPVALTEVPINRVQMRLIYPMVNEAAKCLQEGVASEAWVIDLALVLGTGFAPFRGGPLRTADALGLANLVRDLDALRNAHGDRFEPAAILRTKAAEGRAFTADESRTREPEAVHR